MALLFFGGVTNLYWTAGLAAFRCGRRQYRMAVGWAVSPAASSSPGHRLTVAIAGHEPGIANNVADTMAANIRMVGLRKIVGSYVEGDPVPNNDQFQLAGNAAEFYDRLPARYFLGPWSKGLVDAADVRPDDCVLDLACGTGIVAREAAARLGVKGSVVGLDLNEGMLEVARTHGNPGAGSVVWVQASALETGLPDASFDVVLCQQGLQFFPDQGQVLKETRRILKDGGRLCFSIWAEAGPSNSAVAEAVRVYIDDETANRFLQSRKVPSADELKAMVEAAGFYDVTVARSSMENRLPEIASFVADHLLGVPIADKVRELSPEQRAALGAHAAGTLAQYTDGADAVVPDYANIVTAQK